MKQFMEMKEAIMDENENVIDKIEPLELEENGNRLYAIFYFICILSIFFSFCCPLSLV